MLRDDAWKRLSQGGQRFSHLSAPSEPMRAQPCPSNLQDYVDLVDVTGRSVHPRKRGIIPDDVPRILNILGIAPDEWLKTIIELHTRFHLFIGSPLRLRHCAERRGWRWIRGHASARRLYARANE